MEAGSRWLCECEGLLTPDPDQTLQRVRVRVRVRLQGHPGRLVLNSCLDSEGAVLLKSVPVLFRWYTSCPEEEEDSCVWRRRPSELPETSDGGRQHRRQRVRWRRWYAAASSLERC